jgi:effector-binding domain-containing protein
MKKKVILISLALVVLAVCFIPVTQQKTISVKASFFNTYQQLAKAANWKKWRTDLHKISLTDSAKISEKQDINGFKLNYADLNLDVRVLNGYSFYINENNFDYRYTVLPGKTQDVTSIIVTEKTNFINYLINIINARSFSETHITEFKNFMENPDLYYGYKIYKSKITDTNIVVLRKVILAKNKFTEAAKTLNLLKQYITVNGFKQTQPLIAQFFPKKDDSLQLNVGIPINEKAVTHNAIIFMTMPKTGNIYAIKFHGKFIDREKVYAAAQQYFNDRHITIPILPFETYLDNRLPANDSDIVNIQFNFPSF